MDMFIKKIKAIEPSQLYINQSKLKAVEKKLQRKGRRALEPLPVKRLGDKIFFTDGHTRAFALYNQGIEQIEVYEDEDNLNWLNYLICVQWCAEEGIKDISDLKDRVISNSDYQKLWIERCQKMQEQTKKNHLDYININKLKNPAQKSKICELILKELPEWFGMEEARQNYIDGVKDKEFLALCVGDTPVGFLALKEHNQFTAEIYVLGILKELQGRGLGTKLIEHTEKLLKKEEKEFLTVKTLAPSHPDENYQLTRKFYRSQGFIPLEVFTELWNEENPCLLMAKRIEVDTR